jgi:hypothetical protein
MFVLCENCRQHYDENAQSKKCSGVGMPGHAHVNFKSVELHILDTRDARIGAALAGKGRA